MVKVKISSVVTGQDVIPTATLDVVLDDGQRKLVVANGKNSLEALFGALQKEFGYKVDRYLINVLKYHFESHSGEVKVVLARDDKEYQGIAPFTSYTDVLDSAMSAYFDALGKVPMEQKELPQA